MALDLVLLGAHAGGTPSLNTREVGQTDERHEESKWPGGE
jgi:hypothetical protein